MSEAPDDKVVRLRRRPSEPPPLSEDDYGQAEHEPSDAISSLFADDTLALQFSALHGDTLRYVAGWSRWMRWDGARWAHDDTLHIFDQVRLLCRDASKDADSSATKKALASAKTVAAVEKLARSDRRHAATVAQWDADPWLLNTPGGIVDLRKGDISPHNSAQHMTKTTAVTPHGKCPTWLKFLDEVTNRDKNLQAYLQRVAGYALTGLVREHALFFAYGTGGNGKGTFLNTIQAIMGDYAIVASAETFTATPGSRHLTELARLQGARLVVAQETEEGKHLAEARVKAITGGDPITANFMRQDHFTFLPQFKLFIAGNHKPALRTVDEAIRRRFHMIPFDVQIAAGARDIGLADKLKAEWAGILQWMVEGCLAWQKSRLAPPDAVLAATSDYFEAEDSFGQWICECCNTRMGDQGNSSSLFKSWKAWSAAAGEPLMSQKRFSQTIEARGFRSRKSHGTMVFNGIDVKVPAARSEQQGDRE